ncbi:helix-turn-helix domain-containing protein [Ruegeria atlantica]|uniref:helix-turn-helix domain-containing protein n=1 Tax=Ruegeria atlantica TaxID=81569 RepID=UPI0024942D63|nr:helix-turn-helix transcriptional regulator [Ruegeria atlantica]
MSDPEILVDIYDLVVVPDAWPTILDRIAKSVNARGAIVFGIDEGDDGLPRLFAPYMSSNYDPDQVSTYLHKFQQFELEDQRIFARHSVMGDNVDIVGDDVLAKTKEILDARPNSRAMADFGIAHRAGALLSKDQPLRDRFSLQFSQKQGPLSPHQRRILRTILPHLAKACELARPVRQLDLKGALLAESLENMAIGICILRADGAVITQNQEFLRQIQQYHLFRINPRGRLEPTRNEDRNWFQKLTSSVSEHGQFGARPRKEAMAAASDDPPQLAVEVVPIKGKYAIGDSATEGFMVCSLDTALGLQMDSELIGKVLGLSVAEGSLIEMLADGLSNRQIAKKRDRSIETVNTQVKGLLAKTNCANRTQLIRRAANVGAHFVKSS